VPNYDLPNPAPGSLREVQLFVNSIDREHGREWLPDWLERHGVAESELERARELREAFRALLRVNNAGGSAPQATALVDAAARRLHPELHGETVVFAGEDAVDEMTAIALTAMLDGSWKRLKVCRKCEWAFYDNSKNRSGSWCSMQLCGNRLKTRAYRSRRKSGAA
jgi:predicted RNA-binding Zn ribbon-like protein